MSRSKKDKLPASSIRRHIISELISNFFPEYERFLLHSSEQGRPKSLLHRITGQPLSADAKNRIVYWGKGTRDFRAYMLPRAKSVDSVEFERSMEYFRQIELCRIVLPDSHPAVSILTNWGFEKNWEIGAILDLSAYENTEKLYVDTHLNFQLVSLENETTSCTINRRLWASIHAIMQDETRINTMEKSPQLVVVAVTPDSSLAGFTHISMPDYARPITALQAFTFVKTEFRELGLASKLKQRAYRELFARNFRFVFTRFMEANHSIRVVNERLGFAPKIRWVHFQLNDSLLPSLTLNKECRSTGLKNG